MAAEAKGIYKGRPPTVDRARIEGVAREGVVLCTTRYVTAIRGDGSSTTRKSVNCEE